MTTQGPDGEGVVLDVAQLEALLAKTFNIGIDAGRGKDPVALVRLRLSEALLGAAEAQALMRDHSPSSVACPLGRSVSQKPLALHAAAFNGIPDPVFLAWTARVLVRAGIEAVIAWLEAGDPGRDPEFLSRTERGLRALVQSVLEGERRAGRE